MNEIIDDMDIIDYHKQPNLSSTALREIWTNTPLHCDEIKKFKDSTKKKKRYGLDVREFGNGIHHALQTKNIGTWGVIIPNEILQIASTKTRGLEFDKWKSEQSNNLTPITLEEYKIINSAMEAGYSHPIVKLFLENGIHERSGFCELLGVPVKARPDTDCTQIFPNEKFPSLLDIKTRRRGHVNKNKWEKDLFYEGIFLQAGLQILVWRELGHKVEHYFYILIERVPPFHVEIYRLTHDWMKLSINGVNHLLMTWKRYLENGSKISSEIKDLELKDWQIKALTF